MTRLRVFFLWIYSSQIHLHRDAHMFFPLFFSRAAYYRVLNRITVLHSGSWWLLFIILASLCQTETALFPQAHLSVLGSIVCETVSLWQSSFVSIFRFQLEVILYGNLSPCLPPFLGMIISTFFLRLDIALRSASLWLRDVASHLCTPILLIHSSVLLHLGCSVSLLWYLVRP